MVHDLPIVVIAQSSAHLFIRHVAFVLPLTPKFGGLFRVNEFKGSLFPRNPTDTAIIFVEELLDEFPQHNCFPYWNKKFWHRLLHCGKRNMIIVKWWHWWQKLDFWKLSDLVRLLYYSDSDKDVSSFISVQISYPLLKEFFFHTSSSTIVSQVKHFWHVCTLWDSILSIWFVSCTWNPTLYAKPTSPFKWKLLKLTEQCYPVVLFDYLIKQYKMFTTF